MAQLQSTSITGSLQVSTNITASNISASLSASFVNGTVLSASYAGTANAISFVPLASTSASWVSSSVHITNADTASTVTSPLTASIIFAPTNFESPSYQLTQSYTSIYGAAYTIANADNGKLIMFTSSVVQNVTLTTSSVDGGWSGMFYQSGSSKISFLTASTSVVLRTRSGLTGSAGQYAIVNVLRVPNGDFILSGDVG